MGKNDQIAPAYMLQAGAADGFKIEGWKNDINTGWQNLDMVTPFKKGNNRVVD